MVKAAAAIEALQERAKHWESKCHKAWDDGDVVIHKNMQQYFDIKDLKAQLATVRAEAWEEVAQLCDRRPYTEGHILAAVIRAKIGG